MNHWDLAYLAAAPFFLGAAGYKRWRHGKYRRSLPGMFGANLPHPPLAPHRERVWMHGVSVGETVASAAVFRLLRERRSGWEFLVTTTTETGQDQAHRSMAAAQHFDFAPVDLSWRVERFLDAYRPSIYLFFETEIWPNILERTGRRGIPIFLVNGKLSDRSAAGYARLRPLLGGPLGRVQKFFVQTDDDAARFRHVLGPSATIIVTGNVKFDNLPKPLSADEREAMRSRWGIAPDEFLILAGSTHDGEERTIAEHFQRLSRTLPHLRLMLAPRHPERFGAVAESLESMGLKVHRLSSGGPAAPGTVCLLDLMGVLGQSFGGADLALLGGSWKPVGGHNLLEPSAHGVPVIHGPHMHEQKEIMRIMKRHGAGVEAAAADIGAAIERLAGDPAERARLGERGREAASGNAGAAHRTVELLLESLDSTRVDGGK